jgi:hypothetical protein
VLYEVPESVSTVSPDGMVVIVLVTARTGPLEVGAVVDVVTFVSPAPGVADVPYPVEGPKILHAY